MCINIYYRVETAGTLGCVSAGACSVNFAWAERERGRGRERESERERERERERKREGPIAVQDIHCIHMKTIYCSYTTTPAKV